MELHEGKFSGTDPEIRFNKLMAAKDFLETISRKLQSNPKLLYVSKKRAKNQFFANDYHILDKDYIPMLSQLTPWDCIDVSPNTRPDYPKVLTFEFRKKYYGLEYYGEPVEAVDVYIKLYINYDPSYQNCDPAYAYGNVVVISFHENE